MTANSTQSPATTRGNIDKLPGNEFESASKSITPPFEGVLYGYDGKRRRSPQASTYCPRLRPAQAQSDGGYVQGTYKFDKLKVGLSYGHIGSEARRR